MNLSCIDMEAVQVGDLLTPLSDVDVFLLFLIWWLGRKENLSFIPFSLFFFFILFYCG